jgi:hypothetical protein
MSIKSDIPLILLSERLAVCRLAPDAPYPDWARPGELLALVRTREELSVVCQERFVPPEVKAERSWRALQVQGPLDFSLVGILASIAEPLTNAGVSIFAISTFDTDFILLKENMLERGLEALSQAGFMVLKDVRLSS